MATFKRPVISHTHYSANTIIKMALACFIRTWSYSIKPNLEHLNSLMYTNNLRMLMTSEVTFCFYWINCSMTDSIYIYSTTVS